VQRQRAQPLHHRAFAAGKKARADAVGDIAEAQIEAGGLDLIVLDRLQRLDLPRALDRVAQQLRRQDAGAALQLSRFGRGEQFPGRALALGHREQLALWRLGHLGECPLLAVRACSKPCRAARKAGTFAAACPPLPSPDSVAPYLAATRAPVRRRGMDMRDGFVGSVGNTP